MTASRVTHKPVVPPCYAEEGFVRGRKTRHLEEFSLSVELKCDVLVSSPAPSVVSTVAYVAPRLRFLPPESFRRSQSNLRE